MEKTLTANEQLVTDAVNDAVKEKPTAGENINDLLARVSQKFIEKKIDDFPRMCEEFRMANSLVLKKFTEIGNEGGWSESKNFKFDYQIPTDLYYFMTNLVYRGFWEDDNEKVWRPFLKNLLRGENAIETLMAVKSIYGSSKSAQEAGIL
jgi:hypothetical protein